MFIPTEGIGSAVAKVIRECGLTLVKMEFNENSAVAEFCQKTTGKNNVSSPRASTPRKQPPTLPEGPWEPTKEYKGKAKVYKCGDVEATAYELASDYHITSGCALYRLASHGFITSQKANKKDKGKRYALSV